VSIQIGCGATAGGRGHESKVVFQNPKLDMKQHLTKEMEEMACSTSIFVRQSGSQDQMA
jgi:hypothetical protein